MYTLTKTRFYDSNAFRIEFDEWECFSSFGPFFDVLKSYAEETDITPRRIQLVYQYQFVEDGRKTEFYWDGNFAIYVFNIASAQYRLIYDRLKKICADLNRRISEKKRLENPNSPPPQKNPAKKDDRIYKLYCPKEKNVIEIEFADWECINKLGPFFDVLDCYSKESGIKPRTITKLFNYQFVEDGYNLHFLWDAVSTISVFYITPEQYRMIYDRLRKICGDLNRRIAERKYFEKYGELPNNGRGFL